VGDARLEFGKFAAAIGLALVCCVGIVSANAPEQPVSGRQVQHSSAASEAARRFAEEMQLAEKAQGRDAAVEHLQNALGQRPGHPDNLALEYRIGILLSQGYEPNNPRPWRREEAVVVFRYILQTYKHMDYYSKEPVNSSGDMQLMIPKAALHLASSESDPAKARVWIHFAMECMAQTCARRVADWTNEPAPREVREDDPLGGPLERAKWQSRMHRWQQRREKAAEGDVFSLLERSIARDAVHQYRYRFGTLRPTDVAIPMGRIVRDFPGTPMARIAQPRIDRIHRLFPDLDLEKLLDDSLRAFPEP